MFLLLSFFLDRVCFISLYKKKMSFTIPETQKACVFEKCGAPIQYTDIPVPTPKPNEILVNILFSGVCHTDLHVWQGDGEWQPSNKPECGFIGGHEGAGVVVAVGDLVQNFKIGDYAGVKWLNSSCLSCEYCMQGAESSCPSASLSGFTQAGTFAQYCVADALQAAKLSADMPMDQVAPILCSGLTVYKALKTANLSAGQWVAISGAAGGLGSLAIQYAKAMGLRVVGIDGGDDKKELCEKLGAEAFVDFTKRDVVEAIREITNGGAHGVINVSVSERAIEQSTEYVRILGTVVLVGLPAGAVCRSNVFNHVIKSISIKGSYVGNRQDTVEALDFFQRGLVKSPIKVVGLSELPMVFDLMQQGKILGRYVLDTSK